MKKIGIFGGSFDPVHIGHLNIAIEMLERHHLDEVWLCPTSQNPFKNNPCVGNEQQRLAMLKLAIEDIAGLKISEADIYRKAPAYTVDLLRHLVEAYPQNHFYLIIGNDSALAFHKWHQPEQIIQYAHLLVGVRTKEAAASQVQGSQAIIQAIQQGWTPHRVFEISSTEIRERLAQGKCCRHLLPVKVLDYIQQHRLYSEV